jgi:hypothetical protein
MQLTRESHLDVQAGSRQPEGCPYHFAAPSQDDRIRKVFGLSDGAPLPLVREETLASYYEYLLAQLQFPFEALYCQNDGEMRQLVHYVRVLGLVDPRQGRNHSLRGLLCRVERHKEVKGRKGIKEAVELPLVEFGVLDDHPHCQPIDDYAYWFVNCR